MRASTLMMWMAKSKRYIVKVFENLCDRQIRWK